MGTLQALLSELSGLKKPRGILNRLGRRLLGMQPKPPPKYRILVMMATNMPQALDEALLRPGRIDRMYKVGYPSKEGRHAHLRGLPGQGQPRAHPRRGRQARHHHARTPPAPAIKDLVNEALINAIRDGREAITWNDVIQAKHLKELGPPEDVEYIERERHAIAVHEACHAVAAYRTRKHLTIDLATIEKGGTYLGMVSSVKPEDQFTRWRSEYEADIVVSLASLAGERLFFGGDNSSGVSGDLESATTVATLMEGYWGMGRTVASHGVTHRVGIGGGGPTGRSTTTTSATCSRATWASASRPTWASCSIAPRRCCASTAPRCCGWPTPSRPTRPSPARTWSPSSRAPRARSSTGGPTATTGSCEAMETFHGAVVDRPHGRTRRWPSRCPHDQRPDTRAGRRVDVGRRPPVRRARRRPVHPGRRSLTLDAMAGWPRRGRRSRPTCSAHLAAVGRVGARPAAPGARLGA